MRAEKGSELFVDSRERPSYARETVAGGIASVRSVASLLPNERQESRSPRVMAPIEIEARLAVLERDVADLKSRIEQPPLSGAPWWELIAGTFAADPAHDEATRLGRQYRESLRPARSGARKG